ncbi:hypothetical protein [Arthrobacter sp. NPDC090010]|uniref:hypothetical protein n=1 Tax=Arthrobacter sp. NPDC090010 TaxID=3363942 RepID=UPI00381FF90F
MFLAAAALLSRGLPSASGAPEDDPMERGDVPGWVMVTLMTAALVALLLALAGPALESLFRQAIDTVSKK